MGVARTVIWTIVPIHELYASDDEAAPGAVAELSIDGRILVVRRDEHGNRQVERLLSTDPADYLNPAWQPGAVWRDA